MQLSEKSQGPTAPSLQGDLGQAACYLWGQETHRGRARFGGPDPGAQSYAERGQPMEPCPPDSAPGPWEQHPPSSEALEVEGLHLLSDCSVGVSWPSS